MLTQIIQLAAVLLFITGACLYYNIRQTLFKKGYPVSKFVYSGPCWDYYNDLIKKSEPAEQSRLIMRKRIMSVCLISALLLLLVTGFVPKGN